ncbi:MAG: DUF2934 domain-containing protein [Acidobacteriales bacterium]|nr:DUF2934 domain-containing protein [Terriglobales bacterium]
MARKSTAKSPSPTNGTTDGSAVGAKPALEVRTKRAKSAARPRKSSARIKTTASENHDHGRDSEQVTREDIAHLAYAFWKERGCQGGSPDEDWFRAESELRSRGSGE